MRTQIRARLAMGQAACAFFRAEVLVNITDEVHRASQAFAVDHNFNPVAVLNFSDGSTGQCLRRNMADARSCRNTTEARISENGDVLAMRQLFEGGSDLINLLHARARRTAAD